MLNFETIRRYLSVYICIGVMFATYSFALDLIYYSIQNYKEEFLGSWGWYLLLYLTFVFLTLPVTIIYNVFINKLPKKNSIRIICGVLAGALSAVIFGFPSFYGGSKSAKTFIVMILVGFTTEIIRIYVVRRREQKKLINSENFN